MGRGGPAAHHHPAGPARDVRTAGCLGDPRAAPARVRAAGPGRAARRSHRVQSLGRRSAGGMISSGADVDRFLGALVGGRLLRPAQLREMMRTRPTGAADGRAYGLGLESRRLPCGGLYWGHGGDIFGYETASGATVDGGQATVMVNLDPGGSDAQSDDMKAAVQTALCQGRSTAP
ncbi:serine hydrolase [Actinomadura luteofluorescens]|uniref:serine hydrolase n=1 Tax=Actinomadura luteofluorescens TaxID=46163 RepID=UPI00363D6AAF